MWFVLLGVLSVIGDGADAGAPPPTAPSRGGFEEDLAAALNRTTITVARSGATPDAGALRPAAPPRHKTCAVDLNGNPISPAEAAAQCRTGCENGEAESCWMVASWYTEDSARAASLYDKACAGGEMRACNDLGMDYASANGVPKDIRRAIALLQKACEGGDSKGCVNLGAYYQEGKGIRADIHQAAVSYQKGCDAGEPTGCLNLGFLYQNGRGVVRDSCKAVALYVKACTGGDLRGCGNADALSEKCRRPERQK